MRILLACGGTGGHLVPAVSVLNEIMKKNPSSHFAFVCDTKNKNHPMFDAIKSRPCYFISSAPLTGSHLLNGTFFWKNIKGVAESLKIVKEFKPDVTVGFGAYSSFPVLIASKLRGVPIILHEQNVIPGLTNRLAARWADKVALSFSQTQEYLPKCLKNRLVVTGNPIRNSIRGEQDSHALLKRWGFESHRKTILVMGGSQGSYVINDVFFDSLSKLSSQTKNSLQVIHLTGVADYERIRSAYSKMPLVHQVFDFYPRPGELYALSDLLISRAGATTLAEIRESGIFTLLIPYPHGGGHQKANAQWAKREGLAEVIEEKELNPALLASRVSEVLKKNNLKSSRAHSAGNVPAAEQLCSLILSFGRS